MRTREEAIAWLRRRDIGADARDWCVGESIQIWDKMVEAAGGFTILTGTVYVYPDDRLPGNWVLDFMYVPGPVYTTHPTLMSACEAVYRYMTAVRTSPEAKKQYMDEHVFNKLVPHP